MNERDVQARAVKLLRQHHWKVYLFSMHKSVPIMMKGWCDAIAVRWDHVWFIEFKGTRGIVSDAQFKFHKDIKRNSGTHVDHVFVWPDTDVHSLALFGLRNKPHGLDDYPPEDLR
jgi:hypothetical protein